MGTTEDKKDGSVNGVHQILDLSDISSETSEGNVVPDAAIKWIALNCSSDTELAILSNTSRRWRSVVARVILSLVNEIEHGLRVSDTENSVDEQGVGASVSPSLSNLSQAEKSNEIPPLITLLLPSMLIEQTRLKCANSKPSSREVSRNFNSKRGRSIQNKRKHPTYQENFCLAWFHPMGIQMANLASRKNIASVSCHERTIPCITVDQILSSKVAANDCLVSEWLSYRSAEEILRPFRYSKAFIQQMISSLEKNVGQNSESILSNAADQGLSCNYAVRGATVAKPWFIRRNKKLANRISVENLREHSPRIVLERQHSGSKTVERQLAVQFLSYDRSRAVCMNAGPWQCGEVDQPITVFVVGIATEDGVFFSGLNRRFLLGHMYPDTAQSAATEMSNICICTESTCANPTISPDSASNFIERLRLESDVDSSGVCTSNRLCSTQLFGSSDSSDDEGAYLSSNASTPPMSDAAEDEIFRGRTGPGKWHCYTAVFDGKNSTIRVDGLSEARLGSMQQSCGNGSLDGLTIGSDHRFHLSLCFGDGSEGEGEGAISELAIFKGRLPIEDILSVECYLMNKHGIRKADEKVWTEDEMRRRIHALILQPPPWPKEGAPIPLRLAAQHPSVAWFKVNPVTGNQIAVKRIGCRSTAQSSDW